MYLGGEGISGELVGDLQGVNNIEAPSGWRLYESWVEVAFGEHTGSLRAGVLDLNAEFDTPVTQGLFIASPFGVGTELSQTGVRGPGVWPTTGLGVRASGLFTDGFTWRLGAYDGAPGTDDDAFTSLQLSGDDGALLIGELEYSSGRVHKAALGGWAYTAPFERIDSVLLGDAEPEHGNQGFYATFDVALGVLGGVNFDGALRAGKAPARFNTVDRYVGVAVSASQLWESRPGDALGLGVAYAHVGTNYQAVCDFDGTPATSSETVVELVYRAELAPWVSLVPNVQFVNSTWRAARRGRFMDSRPAIRTGHRSLLGAGRAPRAIRRRILRTPQPAGTEELTMQTAIMTPPGETAEDVGHLAVPHLRVRRRGIRRRDPVRAGDQGLGGRHARSVHAALSTGCHEPARRHRAGHRPAAALRARAARGRTAPPWSSWCACARPPAEKTAGIVVDAVSEVYSVVPENIKPTPDLGAASKSPACAA